MKTTQTKTTSTETPSRPAFTKAHDLTPFTSKDDSRFILQGVHYSPTDQRAVATDGKILVKVAVPQLEEKDLPANMIENTAAPSTPLTIPTGPFKKAIARIGKGNLPCMTHSLLSTRHDATDHNDRAAFTTTDLDTVDTLATLPIQGQFPKYDQVIPTEKPDATINLNPELLKVLVDYYAKHSTELGRKGNTAKKITLEFRKSGSPLVVKGLVGDHLDALTLIMPML